MALLSAEDVLNKAFSKTKYREGFDQDEVDDFLDEVANTIAQLTAERDDLAARVANGPGAAAAPVAEAPAVTSAGGVPGTTGLLAAATEPGGANPTGMLAMAQKLHDEYVQAGEAERDRILGEANAAADEIRERADGDAKARMDALAGERADLEARIDDLRRFERDYRARLKAYLENLLGDLDHSGVAGATGAAGFAAAELPGEDAPVAYESEGDESEIVVVEEPETATPVSFEDAMSGFSDIPEPQGAQDAPEAESADEAEQQPASFEPEPESAPAAPAYDAGQSWESQLAPQTDGAPATAANPFAPVTQPWESQEGTPESQPDVAPEEDNPAPYTPPSSRMFNDLYGNQRPEQGE